MPPSGSWPYGAWSGAVGTSGMRQMVGMSSATLAPTRSERPGPCDRAHRRGRWWRTVTRSYIGAPCPCPRCLRPGGRNGVASHESRDPIGYAVAALNQAGRERAPRPARAPQARRADRLHGDPRRLPDGDHRRPRLRSRRPCREARHPGVVRAGPGCLRPDPDRGRADARRRRHRARRRGAAPGGGRRGRPPAPHPTRCSPPPLEIGLPLLGVPESLGGISEERAVMAGTLVAEALAQG